MMVCLMGWRVAWWSCTTTGVVTRGCVTCCVLWLGFFFKQKTAYEMRISDWSSDVCSSDLVELPDPRRRRQRRAPGDSGGDQRLSRAPGLEIGRASCRERVCQYV